MENALGLRGGTIGLATQMAFLQKENPLTPIFPTKNGEQTCA